MAVRKRRDNWWVDFQFEGVRYRRPSPENSRAGARAYEATLRHKLAVGEAVGKEARALAKPLTFHEASERWMSTYVVANTKPSTQLCYESMLRNHLVPRFGRFRIDLIKTLQIEQMKAELLRKGKSPKRINNVLSVLRCCLSTCKEWGLVDAVPRVQWMRVPPQPFDFLTVEDSEILLHKNSTSWSYDMILCALRTGMRVGEMLALRWADVDFATGIITVRRSRTLGVEGSPKNNRMRQIPIADDLSHRLKARFHTVARDVNAHVFTSARGGPLDTRAAQWILTKSTRRAQIRPIGWHVLRHTFASHLATNGTPLIAIQKLLGHSTIQMTMRYAHVAPDMLRTAVRSLGRASRSVTIASPSQSSLAVGTMGRQA